MLPRVEYPDFADRNTRSGTLGIVAAGAIILAAPFAAQAVAKTDEPATTEVTAGGITLHDANGDALQCTQTSAADGLGDGTGTWSWDCADTDIQIRADYTMTDEAERADSVARMYWQFTGGEQIRPDEIEHPAPGVYVAHLNDVSVAAAERGDLTAYVAASHTAGREIIDRFVAKEAR